jgi:hypothetical protein
MQLYEKRACCLAKDAWKTLRRSIYFKMSSLPLVGQSELM